MTPRQRVIVKLGGSLAESTLLLRWLRELVRAGGGRATIVPGGGVFADQVRVLQDRWRLSDPVAHRMAILAMEQYGHALAARVRGLEPCRSIAAIERTLARGRVPVWLPDRMLERADDVAASWRVTSDALAAWLAGRLGAQRVVIVKSCPIPPEARGDPVALSRRGIVDSAFAGELRRAGASLVVVNKNQWRRLPELLAGERP